MCIVTVFLNFRTEVFIKWLRTVSSTFRRRALVTLAADMGSSNNYFSDQRIRWIGTEGSDEVPERTAGNV